MKAVSIAIGGRVLTSSDRAREEFKDAKFAADRRYLPIAFCEALLGACGLACRSAHRWLMRWPARRDN